MIWNNTTLGSLAHPFYTESIPATLVECIARTPLPRTIICTRRHNPMPRTRRGTTLRRGVARHLRILLLVVVVAVHMTVFLIVTTTFFPRVALFEPLVLFDTDGGATTLGVVVASLPPGRTSVRTTTTGRLYPNAVTAAATSVAARSTIFVRVGGFEAILEIGGAGAEKKE